jgi:AraC-like DNA-binding protein
MEMLKKMKSEPNLNTYMLSWELGLSRSQLHIRIKALTGQSTGKLIRAFRLNYARKRIECNYGNIAQVSYECGFSTPSYFAEVFKNQFGILPSEYAKSIVNN